MSQEPPAPAAVPEERAPSSSGPPEPAGDVAPAPSPAASLPTPQLCRSCSKPILWAMVLEDDRRTVKLKDDGKKPRVMPVDWQPDPNGNVVTLRRGRSIVAFTLKKGETPPAGARLRTAHHQTCPEAKQWRRTRR